MKAVDFIKKFGWEKAKDHLSKMDAENWHNYFFSDLKQYVDAWELVQDNGGLKEALEFVRYAPVMHPDIWKLQDAIALVEEVENV